MLNRREGDYVAVPRRRLIGLARTRLISVDAGPRNKRKRPAVGVHGGGKLKPSSGGRVKACVCLSIKHLVLRCSFFSRS